MAEITISIPAILANKLKQRYRSDTRTFLGPQETLPNGVMLVRKGLKYSLKGESSNVKQLMQNEPQVVQSITATLNKKEGYDV